MSASSPIVVITDRSAPDVPAALIATALAPVISVPPARAPLTLSRSKPAAIVLDLQDMADMELLAAIREVLEASDGLVPVVTRIDGGLISEIAEAVALAPDASARAVAARLSYALRVRALHASVLRRSKARDSGGVMLDAGDPLDDATVLVAGRGGRHPVLANAIAEWTGIISAPSLEAARSYLSARDIEGVVVGSGFGVRPVDAFLGDLADDSRLRDLPALVVETNVRIADPPLMANLECASSDPADVVARLLPLVRMHALAVRLKRTLAAMEARGLLDAQTGLLSLDAFMNGLDRTLAEPRSPGKNLCLARISFDDTFTPRTMIDAARIVRRLLRTSDIACRDGDGTILVAFNDTHLNTAHLIVRRIASILKHTTFVPDRLQPGVDASVAIAMLKPVDTKAVLLARISPSAMVAAE